MLSPSKATSDRLKRFDTVHKSGCGKLPVNWHYRSRFAVLKDKTNRGLVCARLHEVCAAERGKKIVERVFIRVVRHGNAERRSEAFLSE